MLSSRSCRIFTVFKWRLVQFSCIILRSFSSFLHLHVFFLRVVVLSRRFGIRSALVTKLSYFYCVPFLYVWSVSVLVGCVCVFCYVEFFSFFFSFLFLSFLFLSFLGGADEGLTLETSATHHIPQAKNIPSY